MALALAGASVATHYPAVSQTTGSDITRSSARESVSPRAVTFTVPLTYGERTLGDVLIETTGGSNVRIESDTFVSEMEPLLNEAGNEALTTAIAGQSFVTPGDLATIGIEAEFDQSRLSLRLGVIPGEFRPVESLGSAGRQRNQIELPLQDPEPFSSYLNVNLNLDYDTVSDLRDPEVFLNGATRISDVVVEYDGAFTDQFGEGYRFYRRGVRAVYDDVENRRRYTAGDLRVPTIPVLRTPFIGGVSVEKGRRIFDPFLPVARLGGREIFLDSESTVEVRVNGDLYQTFQLNPGRYDLADLPVQLGANDIELIVNDSAGRRQVLDFDYFFEPLDLPAGEEEYSIAAGLLAQNLTFEPDYSDDFAVSAYYRRALTDNVILGGAIQASEDLQLGAVTGSFVPQVIPGAFEIEAAASTGNGNSGFAVRGSYRFSSGSSFSNSRQLSINVDYESEGFQTLADVLPIQFDLLSISATYTQSFSARTYLNTGAIYSKASGLSSDRVTVFADVVHRLSDHVRLTGGIEYGTSTFLNDEFGIRVGLAVSFGRTTRANVDYRSRTDTLRATLSRGSENSVGSFGYDLGFTDTRGQTSADASANYVGNRFDARLLASSNGPGIGSIDDRQTARLQIGTSLAFAGGSFGIGRPINDSFAVIRPDEALPDTDVIAGRNLSGNEYDARSGLLGGAVQGDLVSYGSQGVQFDVADPDSGADIGDGVVQVEPPYRAGYEIIVGSAYYVSATGFLERGGEPVALAGGTIQAPGDPDFETQPFFTNSAGRFAVIGLAPGGNYVVTLASGERFTITIEDDMEGVAMLGRVEVETQPEQVNE